ncbi:hypothetical protein [Streptomyces sp. NPDC005760]|uniref:hypothetical protein n=1 Tax=Streptomyces sp. NPDC005760 TaxID=3156718 RepID=UPI0033E96AB0
MGEVLAQVPGVLGAGDEFEQPVLRLGAPGLQRLGGGEGHGQDVGEAAVGGQAARLNKAIEARPARASSPATPAARPRRRT